VSSAPEAFLMVRSVPEGVTVQGCGTNEVIPLKKESVLLGRSPNSPEIPKPDIEINDLWVSGKHATIYYDRKNNCFMLRDEGSTHGTFLNDKRLLNNETRCLLEEPAVIGLVKHENEIRIKLMFWVGTLTRIPGELRVDIVGRRVYLGDDELGLTKKEFDVLSVLHKNLGAFCGWKLIGDSIWGKENYEESVVRRYISSIREKISKKAPCGKTGSYYIRGEHGKGYKLVLD